MTFAVVEKIWELSKDSIEFMKAVAHETRSKTQRCTFIDKIWRSWKTVFSDTLEVLTIVENAIGGDQGGVFEKFLPW